MKIVQIYCPTCQASFILDEVQFKNRTVDMSNCRKCGDKTRIAKLEIEGGLFLSLKGGACGA